MKIPARYLTRIGIAALAVAFLPLEYSFGFQDDWNMRRLARNLDVKLASDADVRKLYDRLLNANDDSELVDLVAAIAYVVNDKKAYDEGLEIIDDLLKRNDLRNTLIAAHLLVDTAGNVKKSNYALNTELKNFPDSYCERAAKLLDHPNAVVQAMGEWALTLRIKGQDSTTRALDELFLNGYSDAAWYQKWKSRPEVYFLIDDYARQLVQLNQHFSIAGVQTAVDAIAARMEALAADPATDRGAANGPAYATALQDARSAIAAGDLNKAHFNYLVLRKVARDQIEAIRPDFPREGFVFYTNPRITGGVWNVNVVVTNRTAVPEGELLLKRNTAPDQKAQNLLSDKSLGEGSFRGIDLTWESDKVLFSYWHQPVTGVKPFGWDPDKNAFLYELDLASGNVKQLTNEPGYNDVEPVFLPDGGYVFSSDRSSYGNQCAGPILQNKRCTTLYRLDPRRADKPVAISNNKDFDRHASVLNDGTIVFMHWEYQERGLYHSHNVWRCRPDGTNMDAYYKQHISAPMSIRDVKQVPGSDLHVATAQGHHDAQNGPMILFNPSRGVNNSDAMWNVTPGVSAIEGGFGPLEKQIVPQGGVQNGGGSYINPFPLSEKGFIVGHDMHGNESEFAIYYIDVFGNRELLHRDKDMSCFQPIALRERVRPPVVADMINPEATYATAFLEDVYRDLPGVQRGDVKWLRMSQSLMLPAPVYKEGDAYEYNHLHYLPGDATTQHFGHWAWSPTRTVGLVKVEPDGSAYFKVPAGTPVYLQALDENFCEVRRMRTSFTLQRGEFRSCTGCHETRLETVGNRKPMSTQTLSRGPQEPIPPTWGENVVLDYREHIQPIFDQNCVSCHDQSNPAGGIELTDREIGGFYQSYRSIFGLKPNDPTPVNELDWHLVLNPNAKDDKYIVKKEAKNIHKKMQANDWPGQLVSISDRMDDARITQPLQFGSNKSILIRTLLDENTHHAGVREKMSDEDWLKLVTWVDHNAIYHSTVFDVREYRNNKTFTRVPYNLPSVWTPADLNPTFYNKADNTDLPNTREALSSN